MYVRNIITRSCQIGNSVLISSRQKKNKQNITFVIGIVYKYHSQVNYLLVNKFHSLY